jgi:adenylate cyclase
MNALCSEKRKVKSEKIYQPLSILGYFTFRCSLFAGIAFRLSFFTLSLALFPYSVKAQDAFTFELSSCDSTSLHVNHDSAQSLYRKESYSKAKHIFSELIPCAREIDQKAILAQSLVRVGQLLLREDEPLDLPTQNFLEAMSLFEEINNNKGIASCHLQLGVVDFSMKRYEYAVDHFLKIQELDEASGIHPVTNYLLALSYSELEQFPEAEKMFELARSNFPEDDSLFHLQIACHYGKMLLNKGEAENALKHLNAVLNTYQEFVKKEDFSPIYAFLSSTYVELQDYPKAIESGRQAYAFSSKSGAQTLYLKEALESLHLAFSKSGSPDSGYYYLRLLNDLNDKVENEQVQRRVAQMIGQYAFEREMNQRKAEEEVRMRLAAKELEKQRLQRNLFLIGFVMILIAAGVFLRQKRRISQEKRRSEDLLLNILPEEVVEELKDNGTAEARNFDNVSILFTDFKEFTQKSSELSASELVEEINVCFKAFDQIMEKYGIEKIKTIGDAYMAAGGLHIPRTSEPKDVVLAGLEMQQFMLNRKEEREKAGLIPFEMRAGIHTGPVVAGIVGVKKFQYDIWGDTVNTASRVESHGEVGKVNISDATHELIKEDPSFSFESRGKIEVKGKGELDMFFVVKSDKG